ncbi:sulfite exporter TauE/SafE family protein [Bremerella cremea]|uniref:sulfite exporter TauE/SafE family protein n=1 Tax=Bremerella cremea TaxID=1031537 RepID=UPI0031EA7B1D
MTMALAILFGCIVGFALGLTGGGGGIFAVPLLVYGLGVPPSEAVGISLAAVGGTAISGALPRLLRNEVELRTGLFFAIAGMLGAPIGSYLSKKLPGDVLLTLFAFLMFVVAYRMWQKAKPSTGPKPACEPDADRSACQRTESGELILTSRCARLLLLIGLATGVLSGLFGVGGGFVIVPALVLFSGMHIHRAIATSLFVIVLISASGAFSHFISGKDFPVMLTLEFLVGGFLGMWLGGLLSKRLNGATLQKVFATAVILVALFVIVKSTLL